MKRSWRCLRDSGDAVPGGRKLRFRGSTRIAEDGHDVTAVSEIQDRSVDRELMELAVNEGRILLTEDKDFGWLAFVGRQESPGVILIRYPAAARGGLGAAVRALVQEQGSRLERAFVVLRPGLARLSERRHRLE